MERKKRRGRTWWDGRGPTAKGGGSRRGAARKEGGEIKETGGEKKQAMGLPKPKWKITGPNKFLALAQIK